MLTLRPFSRGIEAGGLCKTLQPLSLSFRTGVWHLCTRTYVRLLGPCFKTGKRKPFRHPQSNIQRQRGSTPQRHFRTNPTKHDNSWPQRPDRKRTGKYDAPGTGFLRFLFSNFRYSLTLFSKFFASFPHGTCTLSVSHQYLALDGIYHPIRAAIPNNSTRRQLAHATGRTGVSPSLLPRSKGLGPAANASVSKPQFGASKAQISSGLFPLQSPLLRES
jgi:hypothetical protein